MFDSVPSAGIGGPTPTLEPQAAAGQTEAGHQGPPRWPRRRRQPGTPRQDPPPEEAPRSEAKEEAVRVGSPPTPPRAGRDEEPAAERDPLKRLKGQEERRLPASRETTPPAGLTPLPCRGQACADILGPHPIFCCHPVTPCRRPVSAPEDALPACYPPCPTRAPVRGQSQRPSPLALCRVPSALGLPCQASSRPPWTWRWDCPEDHSVVGQVT